jgi:hypothetical protein
MTDSAKLAPIALRNFEQADRQRVQQDVIRAVESNPELFLQRYADHPDSHRGHYVSADLFKETFEQFAESREARGRYNAPVHNAAAVLSAEQFKRVIENAPSNAATVIFLTGIPGAGKTSTIVRGGRLPNDVLMVFEGQLSNPKTSIEKIQMVLDAGLKPAIVAVHPTPENALDNTLQRFAEYGRGAGIGVMADIQGGLPAGLRAVQDKFGDQIHLEIKDVRDRNAVVSYTGWQHLPLLTSEGNREQIHDRLISALERQRKAGRISDAAYEQAFGRVTIDRALVVGQSGPGHRGDAPGRDHQESRGETSVVTPESQLAVKEARNELAGLSASQMQTIVEQARRDERGLRNDMTNAEAVGGPSEAMLERYGKAQSRADALASVQEQRKIAETPSDALNQQVALLRDSLSTVSPNRKSAVLAQINQREAELKDRALGFAMVAGIILPDKQQAERLQEVAGIDGVMREKANMARALAATFNNPEKIAGIVNEALHQAKPGQERVHVAKVMLESVGSRDLRGSTGIFDFAGKREREFAERELPKTLTSVDQYAQAVAHHAKAKDREYADLRERAAVEIPQPSPELKQLLATPDDRNFERTVQAGDKAELLANAQQIESAINKRIGQALNSGDAVAAKKVGLDLGQLQCAQIT